MKNKKEKVKIEDVILCFDIETTSTKVNEKKIAWMWGWSWAENGEIRLGRTWEEFSQLLNETKKKYGLNEKKKAIIWIHNLKHELQYLKGYYKITRIFGNVISANLGSCYILRDTCKLCGGLSLEKLGAQLGYEKGDLDYNLIRTSETALTEDEKWYMKRDVEILDKYITSQKKLYKKLERIPLTDNGRSRMTTRQICIYDNKNINKYRAFVHSMDMTEDEYCLLKQCSMGGYSFSSLSKCEKILRNVHSMDIDSSYPSEYLAARVPVGEYMDVSDWAGSEEDVRKYTDYMCIAYALTIRGVKLKRTGHPSISVGHCKEIKGETVRQQKVIEAEEMTLGLLDLDLLTFFEEYTYESITVLKAFGYDRGFMRKEMVDVILTDWRTKSSLKDTKDDHPDEYRLSKQILNGHSGNEIQDPCRYSSSDKQGLYLYNSDNERYRIYQQGLWILASARYRLHRVIDKLGDDFVSCDTDGIKYIGEHKDIFEEDNKNQITKLKECLYYYSLDKSLIKYSKHELGTWEDEGDFELYKTLQMKCHAYLKNGKFGITLASLNKTRGAEYLLKLGNGNAEKALKYFNFDLEVPAEYSGNHEVKFEDEEVSGEITDYLGKKGKYESKGYVYIKEIPWRLRQEEETTKEEAMEDLERTYEVIQ